MTLKYSHKLNHCPNMFHDNKSTNITSPQYSLIALTQIIVRLYKSIVYSLIATTQIIVKLYLQNCPCCHVQALANRWLGSLPSVELANWFSGCFRLSVDSADCQELEAVSMDFN